MTVYHLLPLSQLVLAFEQELVDMKSVLMVVWLLTVTVHLVSKILYEIMIIIDILDSSIIDRVCTDYRLRTGLAYPIVGTEEDYGVNLIRNVITSISCPVTGTTIDNCNLTTGTTCNGSTNIITCFDGKNYTEKVQKYYVIIRSLLLLNLLSKFAISR